MLRIDDRECRVQLGRVGRVRCEPGWRLGPDWATRLEDFDLWYVWAGRGTMTLREGQELRLAPGIGVWMRPGGRYETVQAEGDRLGVNYLHFTLLAPEENLPLSGFTPPFEAFQTSQPEFADALMRRIVELATAPPSGAARAAASATRLFAALLEELAREQAERHFRTPGPPTARELAVARAVARIREDPGRAPGVDELAREAGFSSDHFSRIFKAATGLPPESFLIQTKMDRARRLLEETALSVGTIADTLGFQDIYFFSRQFKQKTGWTPTGWRRHALGAGGGNKALRARDG
jgi:AraC-like DNA-binding protein